MITNDSPSGPPKNRVEDNSLFDIASDIYPLKRKGRFQIELSSYAEGFIKFKESYKDSSILIEIYFRGTSRFSPPERIINEIYIYVDNVKLYLERQEYQEIYRTMVSILDKEKELIKNKNEEDKQDLFSFLKELKKEYGIK